MTAYTSRDVTCVIPTSGRPAMLAEALVSVLAQTHPPSRVVVVDDTADASARATVLAHRDASPAVGVEHLAIDGAPGPRGASRSRNAGAALASTPLLAFLDDDDLWEPGYLEALLAALGTSERSADGPGDGTGDDPAVDLAVAWTVQARGEWRGAGLRMPSDATAADALGRNPGLTGSNIVVTRAAFQRLGGFDEALWVANDKDFLVRALRDGLAYVVVAEPLVVQRVHGEGQLTSRSERRARGIEAFAEKHREHLTAADRRQMRLLVHSMRRVTAPSRAQRWRHAAAQALLSRPDQLLLSVVGRLRGRRALYD